jgi:hypothetical protein
LQRRLAEPTDVLWAGQTLRAALQNLSRTQQVALMIDRRVDPGRPVNLVVDQLPLGEVFERVAAQHDLGTCMLGPVAYFGPPDVVKRLRTLASLRAEEARKLPAEMARRLFQSKPLSWPDLGEPREVLEQLAGEARLELVGIDKAPHDLWAAAQLPPLSLVDRLTLIAIQFDLTFAVDSQAAQLRLLPVPAEVALVRRYEASDAEKTAQRYRQLAPQAEVKVSAGAVWVKGRLEDHEKLAAKPPHPGSRTPQTGAAATRYTLSVSEQPLGGVLRQLAAQLKLELKVDEKALERAGIALDQRVSFSVKQATVDELFTAALAPASLTFRREGTTLEVSPAP